MTDRYFRAAERFSAKNESHLSAGADFVADESRARYDPAISRAVVVNDCAPGDSVFVAKVPGCDWTVWRWVGLRSSGFPVNMVLKLGSQSLAELADRANDSEDAAARAWQRAMADLSADLEHPPESVRESLTKAMRRLKKGKLPDEVPAYSRASESIGRFSGECAAVDANLAGYNECFDDELVKMSQELGETARDPRFREALIWQNRRAYHSGMRLLLEGAAAGPGVRNQARKRAEELVGMYAQRYCTKNDSIGFFGPVGWANIVEHAEALRVQIGPNLVAERNVYLDAWCVDALAQSIERIPGLSDWIAPRREPSLYLSDDIAFFGSGKTRVLARSEKALIEGCDGIKTAKEIARSLSLAKETGFQHAEEVYARLEALRTEGLIYWSLDIPWIVRSGSRWRVEDNLEDMLKGIGDDSLRDRASRILWKVKQAKVLVERSTREPDKLDIALTEFEDAFTLATGVEPVRASGKMYAGRTAIYEDCRRDVSVRIGEPVIEALASPLALIVTSAKWYIGEIARRCRNAFEDIFERKIEGAGRSSVRFHDFWLAAQPLILGDERGLIKSALTSVQEKWDEILGHPSETPTARLNYSTGEIAEAVHFAFPENGPGWRSACYNSPDIMIAAKDEDAVRSGQYSLVMGEFHVGNNTLKPMVFSAQHPCPRELLSAFVNDLREPLIIPVPPKYMITQRTYSAFESEKDYWLEWGRERSGAIPDHNIQICDLVVERRQSDLVVKTMNGRIEFDILEPFGDLLSEKIANHFKVFAPQDHIPRITFDRLVIFRESWRFPLWGMEFAFEKQEAERFRGARRWAAANNLPRFAFYKSPIEVKPCFLDFASPIFTTLFAKAIRNATDRARDDSEAAIVITEMLPTPNDLWLKDAENRCYTSELRFVTVAK